MRLDIVMSVNPPITIDCDGTSVKALALCGLAQGHAGLLKGRTDIAVQHYHMEPPAIIAKLPACMSDPQRRAANRQTIVAATARGACTERNVPGAFPQL